MLIKSVKSPGIIFHLLSFSLKVFIWEKVKKMVEQVFLIVARDKKRFVLTFGAQRRHGSLSHVVNIINFLISHSLSFVLLSPQFKCAMFVLFTVPSLISLRILFAQVPTNPFFFFYVNQSCLDSERAPFLAFLI